MTDNAPSTIDLGERSGELLVFGGVYGNLQALQALQRIAKERKIPAHNIICTGDIAGYCAQPEECIQAIREWGIHSIAGNVELQLRSGADDCGCDFNADGRCDTFSRQWYPYVQQQVGSASQQWLRELPEHLRFRYGGRQVMVVHGSFHHVSEFIFASTPWPVKAQNFTDTDAEIILAGHCGLPFIQHADGKSWLNSGVIGMPANDGTERVWYMLMEDKKGGGKLASLHPFTYDNEEASDRMEAAGLPMPYAETLRTGIWDNCEILPDAETRRQGIQL